MNMKIILTQGLLMFAAMACSAESIAAAPNRQAASDNGHNGHASHHTNTKKVGAPVTVKLLSSGQTSKNAKLPLSLQFETDGPNVPLRVEYSTDAGLSLLTRDTTTLTSAQDSTVTDTPQVQAAADGVYHLTVFVTIDQRTNAISIPVTVGNPKPTLKSTGKLMQTPRGETLMILPAQETSR
jgi:hypothetical protein